MATRLAYLVLGFVLCIAVSPLIVLGILDSYLVAPFRKIQDPLRSLPLEKNLPGQLPQAEALKEKVPGGIRDIRF